MKHELKIWPEHFRAIVEGRKTFEVRSTEDRIFDEGDTLLLREYISDCDGDEYTGREMTVRVNFVHAGLGMKNGYVCMAISMVPSDPMPDGSIAAKIDEMGRDMKRVADSLNPFVMVIFKSIMAAQEWTKEHISPIIDPVKETESLKRTFASVEEWAAKPIPDTEGFIKRKAGRLVQVLEYLCKNHQKGHTQAALRGARNSDARIVTVTVEEGRRLDVPFLALNHPTDWATTRGPLVFDSSTVEVLLSDAMSVIANAQRDTKAAMRDCQFYKSQSAEAQEDFRKAEARVKELEAQVMKLHRVPTNVQNMVFWVEISREEAENGINDEALFPWSKGSINGGAHTKCWGWKGCAAMRQTHLYGEPVAFRRMKLVPVVLSVQVGAEA
jgi:hypothetical protein